MLAIKCGNREIANNLEVNSIKASKHANSTKVHKTTLLGVNYNYSNTKPEKKHFIFVIDTSSSMEIEDITEDIIDKQNSSKISRIEAVKRAISTITNYSDKILHNVYSIITFNKKAEIILDGKDRYDVFQKLYDIKTGIGTSIYHGMLSVKELNSFGEMPISSTIIILLSDGMSSVVNEGLDIKDPMLIQETLKKGSISFFDYKKNITVDIKHEFFDPKEVLKNLTQNDECPRIFSMGIGCDYSPEYLEAFSGATRTPLTHVTKQSDFSKALNHGLFTLLQIPATIEIQMSNEIHSEKIILYSGKDKEIILDLNTVYLADLFRDGTVQVKIGDNSPQNLSVDIEQINKIDKGMTLTFYKERKVNELQSTGNISLSLMWDIPQTDNFCDDPECQKERINLFQEIRTIKDNKEALQLRSHIGYTKPSYSRSYIPQIDQSVITAMEEEYLYLSPISLEVTLKPTSVLSFNDNNGSVYVKTYDKGELFTLAGLDPEKDSRYTLIKTLREKQIIEPTTRLRIIEPVRDYAREKEITEWSPGDSTLQENSECNLSGALVEEA
ncbi:MAG: VWA domain-containing protein [Rickettsia endosymbiont of Pseudomimeciton antennatum]|nr:VWA domain-containing protein [Rickettsia endosymbiont of Pseudomimeciton antennatum]